MAQQARKRQLTLIGPSIRRLLAIAITCLLVVLGLKIFFDGLQDELREKSANERARLFVGEEIVRGIHGIEKDLYMMAVTTNLAGARRIKRSVDTQLNKLRHDLGVLKQGGTVKREVLLNLEGRDEMVREAEYRPDPMNSTYVMELIEIEPLLDQLQLKTRELEDLLLLSWEYQERGDAKAFFRLHDEIDAFTKHIPPYFARLDENANRLFFDSSARLRELEVELAAQRDRLKKVEMGMMVLVMIFASMIGVFFLRRINIANQNLETALEQMRAAKEEAERASRAKSEFVSRMSHELRTPLNAIIGFADLLEAEPLPPSQKNFVRLINSSGRHLMELINAVLDHAKIEAGGMTLEKIPFDFPQAIEEVCSIVLERSTTKGLAFVSNVSEELPQRIVGDPTRLRQILINLLVNAVKFTEFGSVELRVAIDGDHLVFSIRDTGIGMDKATLERLFQPFAQADDSITRKFGGTGLGLMISKELVEAMGGTIEVDSAPGVGSCFWVRLPLLVADGCAAPTVQGTATLATARIAELVGGRVLLVDDNRVNQQLGSAMLERLKMEFELAHDGEQAVAQFVTGSFALVLMDMEMPRMDGLSATREIRRREQQSGARRTPIIAMTANALAEDRQRCFDAGMDGYISKPINLSALESEISRLFDPQNILQNTSSAATQRPAAETVFDRVAVINMLGDDDLFKELAGIFAADAPGYLKELDDALEAKDWPAVARGAHTLKGLFATFAAAAAEAETRRLEQAATIPDDETCRRLAPSVRHHTEALVAALAAG